MSEETLQLCMSRQIETRDSYNYLVSLEQLGNIETIAVLNALNVLGVSSNTDENSKNTISYIFSIFFNICEESNRIIKNYFMLIYFYDLVDLLKIKYEGHNFISQAIDMGLADIEQHMRENIHSEKTNYQLLKEIIGAPIITVGFK